MAVLLGIKWGLFLAVLVGPLLLYLVQVSVKYGTRKGLVAASGIWFSDILISSSSFLFYDILKNFYDDKRNLLIAGLLSASVLIILGIYSFWASDKPLDYKKRKYLQSYFALFSNGFLINTLNPFTFFFWLGIVGNLQASNAFDFQQRVVLVSTILIVIMLTDSVKVFMSKALSQRLKGSGFVRLKKISALAFILFGLFILFRVLK